jgi:hypothetical protein
VLLPMQGPLQAAAEAIRDGIMSAFIDGPGGAELVFLDAGENGERTDSAYFEARDMGVDGSLARCRNLPSRPCSSSPAWPHLYSH